VKIIAPQQKKLLDHLIGALGASAANLSFVFWEVIVPDYADSGQQPREARQHPDDEMPLGAIHKV
jgi:hypothetical protein